MIMEWPQRINFLMNLLLPINFLQLIPTFQKFTFAKKIIDLFFKQATFLLNLYE